jgi:hypothetical protein
MDVAAESTAPANGTRPPAPSYADIAHSLEQAAAHLFERREELQAQREAIDAELRELTPKLRKIEAARDELVAVRAPSPGARTPKPKGQPLTPGQEIAKLARPQWVSYVIDYAREHGEFTQADAALASGNEHAGSAVSKACRALALEGKLELLGSAPRPGGSPSKVWRWVGDDEQIKLGRPSKWLPLVDTYAREHGEFTQKELVDLHGPNSAAMISTATQQLVSAGRIEYAGRDGRMKRWRWIGDGPPSDGPPVEEPKPTKAAAKWLEAVVTYAREHGEFTQAELTRLHGKTASGQLSFAVRELEAAGKLQHVGMAGKSNAWRWVGGDDD